MQGDNIIFSNLMFLKSIRVSVNHYEQNIEIVERKGMGYPDTVCDNAVERVSAEFSKFYVEEFGSIMHHNVDKALLVGGGSKATYKGGKVIKPIEFMITGRATKYNGTKVLPIEDIATEAIKKCFSDVFRFLGVQKHLIVNVKIGLESTDLVELYDGIGKGEVPLSNDTSYGTGFYPFDELENTVYRTEKLLNGQPVKHKYPYTGEDIKIMGIKEVRLN